MYEQNIMILLKGSKEIYEQNISWNREYILVKVKLQKLSSCGKNPRPENIEQLH